MFFSVVRGAPYYNFSQVSWLERVGWLCCRGFHSGLFLPVARTWELGISVYVRYTSLGMGCFVIMLELSPFFCHSALLENSFLKINSWILFDTQHAESMHLGTALDCRLL